MNSEDKIIRLKDSRNLAYTEHGDANGKPVIFIHGNPGSRYMRHPDENIVETLGIRMITPDRPGYGLSDFQSGRKLLDFPDDIQQLVDALEIDRFYVLGVSAGGPYVAATAYILQDRVLRGSIVSGAAPFDRGDPLEGVNEAYRLAYRSAKQPAWLLRFLLNIQMRSEKRDPGKAWEQVLERAGQADRHLLYQPEYAEQVRGYRSEAVRNGVKGWVQEAKLVVSPWGFSLKGIRTEIDLWYGDEDSIVPPPMGHYLNEHIPNTRWHFERGAGHFLFFQKWQEILEALVED